MIGIFDMAKQYCSHVVNTRITAFPASKRITMKVVSKLSRENNRKQCWKWTKLPTTLYWLSAAAADVRPGQPRWRRMNAFLRHPGATLTIAHHLLEHC